MVRSLLVVAFATACLPAAALTEVTGFGSNPGSLKMFEHVPAGVTGPMPLVLVLHGCTQDRGYAQAVGLVDFADELGFGVVVAETSSANNQNRCFNWFESGDIAPGQGEAESLRQMVARFSDDHDVDASRIFVTGLSAGGGMTSVMLAVEPDLFAAGAVFSGLPYNCGTGIAAAFQCMSPGATKTQAQWASLVTDAVDHTGDWPRVLIVHGANDGTVAVKNAENIALQFTGLNGLPVAPTTTATAGDLTTKTWRAGNVDVVKSIVVAGMDHGTPVDPPGCGTAGAFVLDKNFCGSLAALEFFGLTGDAPVGEGEGDVAVGEGEGDVVVGEGEGEVIADYVEDFGSVDAEWSGDAVVAGGVATLTAASSGAGRCGEGLQEVSFTLTRPIAAGSRVSFHASWDLSATINIATTATVSARAGDQVLLDEAVTFDSAASSADVSVVVDNAAPGLVFSASADSNVCITASASLVIDDVVISAPGAAEGEGDVVAEGEGDVVAEGEGDVVAEGEGDGSEGEGEGEGDADGGCACSSSSTNGSAFALIGVLVLLRRRRR